jgi:hypothetical protein
MDSTGVYAPPAQFMFVSVRCTWEFDVLQFDVFAVRCTWMHTSPIRQCDEGFTRRLHWPLGLDDCKTPHPCLDLAAARRSLEINASSWTHPGSMSSPERRIPTGSS